MSRPVKELSDDDRAFAWEMRRNGAGLRTIAIEVSIRRGAYAANITAKERRHRMVSHQIIKRLFECYKTEVLQNPSRIREAVTREETKGALDVRWSQPQTNSPGERK